MHIVITNDDGIRAPGIHALARAAKQLGKVTVIAPDRNWSVSGHMKSIGRPLRLEPYDFPEADAAWAADGSPSDCAAFAGLGFTDEPVDLFLSGVNPTPNMGEDLTYSGTVMAAVEASIWGLPAAAFSIDCAGMKQDDIDFCAVEMILPVIAAELREHPLPRQTILNVNYPYLPFDRIKGFRITHCAKRIYKDILVRRTDPFGKPYYWFGGDPPESVKEPGSDGEALAEGYISVTPVHQDLTSYKLLEEMQTWSILKKGCRNEQ